MAAQEEPPEEPNKANQPDEPKPRRGVDNLYAAPAAVLHDDGVWLPDGSRIDLPAECSHAGDLFELAHQLRLGWTLATWTKADGSRGERAEGGLIVVTAGGRSRLGIDLGEMPHRPDQMREHLQNVTSGQRFVTAALEAGYRLSKGNEFLGPWTRVWKDGDDRRAVQIGLLETVNPADAPILLADTAAGDHDERALAAPAVIAKRLLTFAEATGYPFHTSPHTTGLDMMIKPLPRKDQERLFTPETPVGPAQWNSLEVDFNWSVAPSGKQLRCRYVHAYDRNKSYPAAIPGLELGIGDPVHCPDGAPFDKRVPGLHRVPMMSAWDRRYPHPLDPRGDHARRHQGTDLGGEECGCTVWVTTPTLEIARELGGEVEILESYIWPDHGRVLNPWYERIRDGFASLDQSDPDQKAVADLLKLVSVYTIGMLGSQVNMGETRNRAARPGYAPTRRFHVVGKARANILRKIVKIGQASGGVWPVAAGTDTVLYVSDEPDPVKAWPGEPADLGTGLGRYKPEASGLLVDHLAYLTGAGWEGKDALTPAAEWDPTADWVVNAPYPAVTEEGE